jgi:hypothetical protein
MPRRFAQHLDYGLLAYLGRRLVGRIRSPLRGPSKPLVSGRALRSRPLGSHVFDVATAVLTQEETLHWLALRMVPGLGTVGTLRVLEKLKSPEAIFRASASELEAAGTSPAQARNIASGCSFEDAVEQQQQ